MINLDNIGKSYATNPATNEFMPEEDFFIFARNFTHATTIPYGCKSLSVGNIPGIKIPFQFINNVSITDRSPAYSNIDIFGRFEPLQIFGGTTSTIQISIECALVATGKKFQISWAGAKTGTGAYSTPKEKFDEEWVEDTSSMIRSLMIQRYGGDFTLQTPPRLTLKIGHLINELPCYLKSINRDWADSPMYVSKTSKDVSVLSFLTDDEKEEIKRQVELDEQGRYSNYLPQIQKLTLSFVSWYPTKTTVDSNTIRLRTKGVSL